QPPAFFAALTEDEQRTLRDLMRKLLATATAPPSATTGGTG
ncbi:MAG: hypothetical protein QOE93_1622, partial [Actinomycetota bacterium]|nr:hypothetical protein [Actinomycetota bacterium]